MPRHFRVYNKKKIIANAEKVRNHFKDCITYLEIINHIVMLTIINPNVEKRDILISFTKYEMTFYFSYQHAHFCNNDVRDLIDYIECIITNRAVAVEIFEGQWDCCGGSREYSSLDLSTAESIAALFSEGYIDLLEAFKNNQFRVYVQCWDSTKDKAIAIHWDGLQYIISDMIINQTQGEEPVYANHYHAAAHTAQHL